MLETLASFNATEFFKKIKKHERKTEIMKIRVTYCVSIYLPHLSVDDVKIPSKFYCSHINSIESCYTRMEHTVVFYFALPCLALLCYLRCAVFLYSINSIQNLIRLDW